MTLAMTYGLDEAGKLLVHARIGCPERHKHTVYIRTEERFRMKPTAKNYYRFAENVLLSNGKVKFALTKGEKQAGVKLKEPEKRVLVCSECEEKV